MSFKGAKQKFKNWIEWLRSLEDGHKKIILWIIIAILGLVMAFFWFQGTINRIKSLDRINFNFPEMEKVNEIPIDLTLMNTELTSDWKTYTNTEYGFEIKYPENWQVKENLQDKKIFVSFIETQDDKMTYPQLIIKILDKTYQEAVDEQIFADSQNDIIFNEIPAKELLFNNPTGAIEQLIIVSKNNKTIRIESFKNSVLDLILSTFKFINEK